MHPTNSSTCAMQSEAMLPQSFYMRGWMNNTYVLGRCLVGMLRLRMGGCLYTWGETSCNTSSYKLVSCLHHASFPQLTHPHQCLTHTAPCIHTPPTHIHPTYANPHTSPPPYAKTHPHTHTHTHTHSMGVQQDCSSGRLGGCFGGSAVCHEV